MAQQVNQDLVEQYKQQFKADIDQHRNWSEDNNNSKMISINIEIGQKIWIQIQLKN